MTAKKTAALLTAGALVTASVIGFYYFTGHYLPTKTRQMIGDKFGEYVEVGAVRYVFPTSVEVNDLVLKRRPHSNFAAEAPRARLKLRPVNVLTFKWDLGVFSEVVVDSYKIYIFPRNVMPPVSTHVSPPVIKLGPGPSEGKPSTEMKPSPRGFGRSLPEGLNKGTKRNDLKKRPEGKRDLWYKNMRLKFRLEKGEVVVKGGEADVVLLRGVAVDGRCASSMLAAEMVGQTPSDADFTLKAEYCFDREIGKASYRVTAAGLREIQTLTRVTNFIAANAGKISLTGWLDWGNGRWDHYAVGNLTAGDLTLATKPLHLEFKDVSCRFRLHNNELRVADGRGRTGVIGWRFHGSVSEADVDLFFQSENVWLQNLIEAFGGGVKITTAGEGQAQLRLTGSPREPEFYLRVEKSLK